MSRSTSVELRLRNGLGEEFPLSLQSARSRLVGLFGDVRGLIVLCAWSVRRIVGRCVRGFAAPRPGCGEAIQFSCRKLSDVERRDGESGEGENGTLPVEGDDRKVYCRKSEPLDGERDKDRRISRIAE